MKATRRDVEVRYLEALEAARSDLRVIAARTGSTYAVLRGQLLGERGVTREQAWELVDYLRGRATELADRADILEEALERSEPTDG